MARAGGHPPSILIYTNLWIVWLDVAFEHRRAAEQARAEGIAASERGKNFGELLGKEMRASMISVSASAHTIDAFYGAVDERTELAAGTRERWKEKRTKTSGRIIETLKAGCSIGAHAGRWAQDLKWLFDLRNAAVHHRAAPQPPQPHPGGFTDASKEHSDYSMEAAQRATELALDVLTKCLDSPAAPEVQRWANEMPNVPDALRAMKGST
jgi:hypothetical protein